MKRRSATRHTAITSLMALLFCLPLLALAVEPDRQGLFRIERSKNANIIQYDALITADGKLDSRKPVVAYWIRLAEQGQVKQLNWIQKTFAYGFKADPDEASESVTLKMAADFGRLIKVKRLGQHYGATIDIDEKPSQLERIYIDAVGKGLFVTVNYIELFGHDLISGEARYEKLVP